MSTRPDQRTLRLALAVSTRAPSANNTQPWRWVSAAGALHLVADRTWQDGASGPDGHDVEISCGAALHHLGTALAALGVRTAISTAPSPTEPDHLAVVEVVGPHSPSAAELTMAGAISARRTERRPFSPDPVPADLLTTLRLRAERYGVLLTPVTGDVERHRFAVAVDHAAANPPLGSWAAADELSAGALLLLSTKGDGTADRVGAGQATSAVLLTATAMGLASCALSQPLADPRYRAEVSDRLLRRYRTPHLFLRIGYGLPAPAPPRTPRRPWSECYTELPEVALG
ncbi:NAD(P)H nitroreductase [Actinokineospora globicatena]|uniref:NAD(P)H nitroreductase n=1 Tax=Actinokineospora globicatena TaxID=103729 RepID=UPI0020A3DC85|nr:NAD(P)H nitroreductase [Actinokineospora globicatena]MCP2306129.1 Nitroreductase family [Actinokineospora globicatena]GLW79996.1 NAD(P)H nitroreductase [Actinokineospora globicatena]GLW86825.1 NAD(P)H nitroreductase [Actinokineospora globicatena]